MGVTLTDAVIYALNSQIEKVAGQSTGAQVRALSSRIAALPVLDSRPAEQILGYDEFGIPW